METCSKEKKEIIQHAIHQIMAAEEEEEGEEEEDKVLVSSSGASTVAVDGGADEEDQKRRLFLTRLLSQLDTLQTDGELRQPESSSNAKEISQAIGEVEPVNDTQKKVEVGSSGIDSEEIANQLKNVRRQNFITHCLLVAMIVLTIGWQVSEVSLLLMVKNGISHPFRSLGGMVKRMLKRPKMNDQGWELQSSKEKLIEAIMQSSTKEKLIEAIEASSIPDLKIPELRHMEFPSFDFSNSE